MDNDSLTPPTPEETALIKIQPSRGGIGVLWSRYKASHWALRVIVPTGLGVVAYGAMDWANNMLSQDEYALAILLTLFFLLIAIGASIAITKRWVRYCALTLAILIAGLSVRLILNKRDGKPWTTFWVTRNLELDTGGCSITPIPPDGSQGIVIHVYMTVRNQSSAPVALGRWKLEYEMAGRNLEIAPTRALKDEPVQAGSGLTMVEPFASQDLLDRVEAITKERPAVGILNFELKGIRKEDVWGRAMKLTVYDDRGIAQPPLWIRPKREVAEGDQPIHMRGLRETVQEPGSTPVELKGTITDAMAGYPTNDEHGPLYILVVMSLLNTGTRPTSVYAWEGWVEVPKGKFIALPMAAPTKRGAQSFGGKMFPFDQHLIKIASKAIQPGGEPIDGWVLMGFEQLSAEDFKPPLKICVRLRERIRDTPYDACLSQTK